MLMEVNVQSFAGLLAVLLGLLAVMWLVMYSTIKAAEKDAKRMIRNRKRERK